MVPMIAATRGPYRSSIVPTGSAETLQVVDAIAKNKFILEMVSTVPMGQRGRAKRT